MRHVALNALFLDPGRSGGTETYLRGLAPALAAEYPATRLTVLTTRRGARALRDDGWRDFAAVVAFPADEGQRLRRLAAEQVLAPLAARRRGADVLHSLPSTGPVRAPLPHVVTVHDVTFFHHATFGRTTTLAMRWIVAGAARHADGLVAVSTAARDEICATLGLAPERFVVAPHGPGREPGPALPAGEVRRRHDIPEGARVVLCVAAVRPHKNQALLVRALEHLPEDTVVVLSGAQEPYVDEVRALAARLGVSPRLRLAGYLPDDELEGLWRTAACAAFPTRAEGFGLPVLEAMRRDVPVACSDIPVLREVGGEVPEYFDPADPAAAAAAVLRARRDPAAAERAGRFTWAATARATMDAYERAVAAAPRGR